MTEITSQVKPKCIANCDAILVKLCPELSDINREKLLLFMFFVFLVSEQKAEGDRLRWLYSDGYLLLLPREYRCHFANWCIWGWD